MLHDALAQVRGVEAKAGPSLALHVVHRGIGLFHQRPRVKRVGRIEADTDARRDEEIPVVQTVRLLGGGEKFCRRHFRACCIRNLGQHHREFVSAHARHGVRFAHRAAQVLRHLLQELVAHVMAQAVVDELEAVEVEEHDGHRAAAPPPRHRERLLETVPEQNAVGQAGQAVVVRLVGDDRFLAFALGDITEDGDVVLDVPPRVAHAAHVEPLWVHLAVLAAVPDIALPLSLRRQRIPERRVERLVVLAGLQHLRRPAERFLRRVAGRARECGVDLDDAALAVGHQIWRAGQRVKMGQ